MDDLGEGLAPDLEALPPPELAPARWCRFNRYGSLRGVDDLLNLGGDPPSDEVRPDLLAICNELVN